jgi:hypothetical protein
MSCGANSNRRVAHAVNRRSTHVAKVAAQTAKRKAIHKPPSHKTRPATKKKTAPKKHATKTASAVARTKAKSKSRRKFHLSAAVRARMRAKARATARRDALRTLHAEELACHNRYRRSAPKTHRHHDERHVVIGSGGSSYRAPRPVRAPRAPKPAYARKAARLAKPLEPDE